MAFGRTEPKRKTNPDHKCRFSFGCSSSCSCGWTSSVWFGKGAKSNAAAEWNNHRDKCEKLAAKDS